MQINEQKVEKERFDFRPDRNLWRLIVRTTFSLLSLLFYLPGCYVQFHTIHNLEMGVWAVWTIRLRKLGTSEWNSQQSVLRVAQGNCRKGCRANVCLNCGHPLSGLPCPVILPLRALNPLLEMVLIWDMTAKRNCCNTFSYIYNTFLCYSNWLLDIPWP